MRKLKVAILADGEQVPRFNLLCLNALRDCEEVTVFACQNTRLGKRRAKHFAYYGLNLFSVRNPLTASVPLAEGEKRIAAVRPFSSLYQGLWQALPPDVVAELREGGFDVVLKFGMYLLKVPPAEELSVPILSHHHGDPDHYRGRPAGFWEMAHGRPVMGQIVQVISNKLDAGSVVAYGETKVLPHSYRATLMSAFAHSPLLINEAVRNAVAGAALPKASDGRNHRLPSTGAVILFVLKMALHFVRRALYGAFFEKGWKVSAAPIGETAVADLVTKDAFPQPDTWQTFAVRPPHTFYADPFFDTAGPGILVEALNGRTGLGEIVLLEEDRATLVLSAPGHLSYPFAFEADGRHLVLPEAASWQTPRTYEREDGLLRPRGEIGEEGGVRVLDPTLLEHQGRFYLFGNDRGIGSNALFIWSAASLDAAFRPHPHGPVLVSPRGARMGGGFVRHEGRLIRLGQSFLGDYGDGLFAFEVLELSPTSYREERIGALRFGHVKGPHTLNFRHDHVTFDWYRDRFSVMAAPRRLMARRRAKAQRRDAGAAASQP